MKNLAFLVGIIVMKCFFFRQLPDPIKILVERRGTILLTVDEVVQDQAGMAARAATGGR
jgi:hypothetical protein